MRINSRIVKAVPVVASMALVLAACGSDGDSSPVAQQPDAAVPAAAPAAEEAAPVTEAAPAAKTEKAAKDAPAADAPAAAPAPGAAPAVKAEKAEKAAPAAKADKAEKAAPSKSTSTKKSNAPAGSAEAITDIKDTESAAEKAENAKIAEQKGGATDIGITKDSIKLGSINMHGMALGNVLTAPQVRG
ncbi:MAG: ABC transporter substrate-binding protein, partial [Sporichthyaceae bacterium]